MVWVVTPSEFKTGPSADPVTLDGMSVAESSADPVAPGGMSVAGPSAGPVVPDGVSVV